MRPPPFRDRHLSRLRLLPSLSQQFFPVLSQPSFSFSSTEKRKAIATVWLPSSPSPGANDAPGPRSSPRAQRTAHSFGSPSARGRMRGRDARGIPGPQPLRHPPLLPPAPGRGESPPNKRGRRAGRMRAALPGVPATLPPPSPRACHFLPSPISVRGQSVSPCRCRRVSASPFVPTRQR